MDKRTLRLRGGREVWGKSWGREGQARVFRAQGLRAVARALTFRFRHCFAFEFAVGSAVTAPAAPPWRKSSASSGYCCRHSLEAFHEPFLLDPEPQLGELHFPLGNSGSGEKTPWLASPRQGWECSHLLSDTKKQRPWLRANAPLLENSPCPSPPLCAPWTPSPLHTSGRENPPEPP